ncbi:MAG: threonylcarbamoyl-AMP synthase [Gammaproteobacteria bacterium]|nr:threonylcarbamoyl-AMP synthase [Gammaproteobacteria bacterium]
MTQILRIQVQHPQLHLLAQVVKVLQAGGVIVYPTDSGYALGCRLGDKSALDRIRRIRRLDKHHHFTLMCRDLSELATYARVNNQVFRILKTHTPGPYTFILKATKDVPRRLQHPHRKTIGLRIPRHAVALALLEALEAPLMSSTLLLPDTALAVIEPEAMKELLGDRVDLVIDGGFCGMEPTTVVDLVEDIPKILRKGKGDVTPFL